MDTDCDFFIQEDDGRYYIPLVDNSGYSLWESPAVYTGNKVKPDFHDALEIMKQLKKSDIYESHSNDIDRILAEAQNCVNQFNQRKTARMSLTRKGLHKGQPAHDKIMEYFGFGRKRRKSRKSRKSRRSKRTHKGRKSRKKSRRSM